MSCDSLTQLQFAGKMKIDAPPQSTKERGRPNRGANSKAQRELLDEAAPFYCWRMWLWSHSAGFQGVVHANLSRNRAASSPPTFPRLFLLLSLKYTGFILSVGRKSTFLRLPTLFWVASFNIGFLLSACAFALRTVHPVPRSEP